MYCLENQKKRAILTKIVMRIFEQWMLSTKEQLNLLGLGENSRYMLQRYKKQESIIPFKRDKLDRVSLLLAIYEHLYALFPKNEKLRNRWIKSGNKILNDQPPIDIMMTQGIIGISKMTRFLDLQMVQ